MLNLALSSLPHPSPVPRNPTYSAMDVDWCLTCGRQTNDWNEAYCSKTCMKLDGRLPQSLPIRLPARRRSFDLPSLSPPHRIANTLQARSANARLSTSVGLPVEDAPSKARFHDDELQDEPTTVVTGRWTGKDRRGILVWARSVSPGLVDEDSTPPASEESYMNDLEVLASFRFTRPPPFPLTAQNLAPPCITLAPRHVLLSHTSQHPPSREEPAVPSLSLDDASLPATESVVTPSSGSRPASKSAPLVGRFVHKVCSWIVPPARTPRVAGSPTPALDADGSACHCVQPPHSIDDKTDASDVTHSSAIKVAHASLPSGKQRPRPRVTTLGSCRLYDYDAA